MGFFLEWAAGGFPAVMKAPGPVAASGLGLDPALSFTFMPEKLQPRVGCGCHNSSARMWAAILGTKSRQFEAVGPGRAGSRVHGILKSPELGARCTRVGWASSGPIKTLKPACFSLGGCTSWQGVGWQEIGATLSVKLLGCSEVCALHVCTWACVLLDPWAYVCMRVVCGPVGLCVSAVCSYGHVCVWHVGLCVVSHGRQVGA